MADAVNEGPKRGVTAKREDTGSVSGSASPYAERRGEDGEVVDRRQERAVDGSQGENGGADEDMGEGISSMMGFGGFGTTKVS